MCLPLPHCLLLAQCDKSLWIFSHVNSWTVSRQEKRKIDFLCMCMEVAISIYIWKDLFGSVVGLSTIFYLMDMLMAQTVKNLPACRRPRFDPWVRKIPCRRNWQSTPVFLLGEFHGQRSLVGYSPWGCRELDMTEWLTHTLSKLFPL